MEVSNKKGNRKMKTVTIMIGVLAIIILMWEVTMNKPEDENVEPGALILPGDEVVWLPEGMKLVPESGNTAGWPEGVVFEIQGAEYPIYEVEFESESEYLIPTDPISFSEQRFDTIIFAALWDVASGKCRVAECYSGCLFIISKDDLEQLCVICDKDADIMKLVYPTK